MTRSTQPIAPGGLTWSRFRSISADVSNWAWGTVQGAFNERASFSQILVDAVIGMIPLVGDVTAVRDIIAVTVGLIDDPEKRESAWEWALLVVLIVALIPVIGGVIKGVGRILIKVFKAASKLKGAARAAALAEGARETIAFLNRIGFRNAEKWLLRLRFADHQAQILERFGALLNTLSTSLGKIRSKTGAIIPESLLQRIDAMREGIAQLRQIGNRMIPKAIKELDANLRELQAYVRSGGETTSRQALHQVAAGEKAVTRADEARLIEGGAAPARSARGGWRKNEARKNKPKAVQKIYKHESGYPNLTAWSAKSDSYSQIEAFSGRIINRPLKPGEKIYRLFGPQGVTHQVNVGKSHPGGAWWGLGSPPRTAKEWRNNAAVLDEWNRDGFMVVGTAPSKCNMKACVGTISEQSGTKLGGQYLPGGGTQAVVEFSPESKAALDALAERVIATRNAQSWTDPKTGMLFTVAPTNWKDANGVWGYLHPVSAGAIQTSRLAARERATKENRNVAMTP